MQDEKRLGTEKISTLMVSLAIPSIVAQLVNVLYNMVDRIYIGRLPGEGGLALTGLGLCFPIIVIVTAFSAFAAAGGAPLAAIALGEGDRHKAERVLGNSLVMLLVASVVLPLVLMPVRRPMLYLFGASDATVGYAMDYLGIYLLGTVFVQVALGLNMFISAQGQAKTAMFSVLIGAVCNIVLDPIFIFVLGMGVRGAALATVISQALSAAWVVRFLLSERSAIRIRREALRPDGRILGSIAALGVAPFIMRATESLVEVVLNNGLQRYGGDLYVGAMTICLSVMQICFVLITGFTQGVQPIVSYNYGAGKYDRLETAFKYIFAVSFAASTLCCLAAVCFPRFFAAIFTADATIVALVSVVLPIFFAGVWLFGLQMAVQTIFISLKEARGSLFLALLRKLFLLVPLALLLPRRFGVMGIFWAEPISDCIAGLTALVLFFGVRRRLRASVQTDVHHKGGDGDAQEPVLHHS